MTGNIRKGTSPRFDLVITDEQIARSVASNSGGCLIADAIKAQYPHLTKVSVDMATIRVTDPRRGERYTYLTPPDAQHLLLSFDQGWPLPRKSVTIRRAVHIGRSGAKSNPEAPSNVARRARRRARIAELERREAAGEMLSKGDRVALANARRQRSTSAPSVEPRPSEGFGPRTVVIVDERPVVVGGPPPVTGAAHPNLLRGRNRHYGAKLANAGEAFEKAVDAEVRARLAAEQ